MTNTELRIEIARNKVNYEDIVTENFKVIKALLNLLIFITLTVIGSCYIVSSGSIALLVVLYICFLMSIITTKFNEVRKEAIKSKINKLTDILEDNESKQLEICYPINN